MTTLVIQSSDTWESEEIVNWAGVSVASGILVFSDANSVYVVGRHSRLGGTVSSLSREELYHQVLPEDIESYEAIQESENELASGIGNIGPDTIVAKGHFAHFMGELQYIMSSIYVENIRPLDAGTTNSKIPDSYITYTYPESSELWVTVSGFGYYVTDTLGLDNPESPRVLVSTDDPDGGSKVYILQTGLGELSRLEGNISALPSGLLIQDLESNRVL